MRLPCDPNTPIPLVHTRKDAGNFVRALTQVPPGKTLLGYGGEKISWSRFMELFSEVNNVKASFEPNTVEDWDKMMPGGMGRELGEMFAYFGEFGYEGGDPDVIGPRGVSCYFPWYFGGGGGRWWSLLFVGRWLMMMGV